MYHHTVQDIISLLKSHDCWYQTLEHEPVKTSSEAAQVRTGYTLSQGAKAMIIRVKATNGDKTFVMLVLPGDKKFDDKKVKQILNSKDIRFATPEEIAHLTDGVQIGGIPPFGNLFGLPVFVDPQVLENEKIIFNAGDRSFSIGMKSADYQQIVNPKVANITI